MANHDQQQPTPPQPPTLQVPALTQAQWCWLQFATNPDECQTTTQHMSTVMEMALRGKSIDDEDLEALQWFAHMLSTANAVGGEYVQSYRKRLSL